MKTEVFVGRQLPVFVGELSRRFPNGVQEIVNVNR